MSTTILLHSADEAATLAYSLPAAMVQDDADVVVVDNASADTTAELARGHRARLLQMRERVSYAAAINRGIALTQGDAVLLLDADCFLAPDFLARARPRLDEDRVGSVAPKLLREGHPSIHAAGMTVDRRRTNGLVGHGRPEPAYARPGEAFGADGAAALYRRSVLEACAIGDEVLDEDLGLWASDADLAWRARLLGWRCAYEPGAVARHVRTSAPSARHATAGAHRRLQMRNRYLMWFKNETREGLLRDLPVILAAEVAALGHVLLRERHLLRGYPEVWAGLPEARRRRDVVQSRRAVRRVPFGLEPPA